MSSEQNLNSLKEGVTSICDLLSHASFDGSAVIGQELDTEIFNWYKERFERCIEDGVPDAVNCYLRKMQKEDINEYTQVCILHAALNVDK